MPAAARVNDAHLCPQMGPGPTPHVGGTVLPEGAPTVLIGHMPAARVGDHAMCTGVGDKTNEIAEGSNSVEIGGKGKKAARLGDLLKHGGLISEGCPSVLIGDVAQGATLAAASGGFVDICSPGPPDTTV